ncbi:hypothetical protein ACFL5X_00480 [Candidatus Omnitrophota bacterium]
MRVKRLYPVLFFLILAPPVFCQAGQEQLNVQKRRIEEEKRLDLKPTQEPLPAKTEEKPEPVEGSGLDYFEYLITKKTASRSDACRSLAVLLNIEDEFGDLDSQIEYLKQKNILPKKIASEFDPDQPLRKGLTAYMFYKALEIKGGVILRVFGISQRYALKELVFQEVMLPGYDRDIVSGKELVLTLTEAAHYLAEQQTKKDQE